MTSLGDWQTYWAQAQNWAQNAGDEDKKREVPIIALEEWQIFYFRGGTWSNPLSSDGPANETQSGLPDGVRAVLTLPPGQAIAGRLTLDWARPTVGGGKS